LIVGLLIPALFLLACGKIKGLYSKNTSSRTGITKIAQFKDNERGTLLWTHYDATQRQGLIFISGTYTKTLSEQSPDAGLSREFEISPKVKVNTAADIALLLKTRAELEQLSEKTPATLITREALYRLSEANFNAYVTANSFMTAFESVLSTAVEIAKADAEAEKAKAEAEKAKAEIQKAQVALAQLNKDSEKCKQLMDSLNRLKKEKN